mgnify:CR=1 FL=1
MRGSFFVPFGHSLCPGGSYLQKALSSSGSRAESSRPLAVVLPDLGMYLDPEWI